MPNATILRRRWGRRARTWDHHVTTSPAFEQVRHAVLTRARARPQDRVVDLGAGTGFLTLPLAADVEHILAIDIA